MNEDDTAEAIRLLFSGLPQLGPGSDEQTLAVLHRLPKQSYERIVDAGCGNGRQTLALARELRRPIDAVDNHAGFLEELRQRAAEAGLAELVRTHCLDIGELAHHFSEVDLLWSEGAAYNLGFATALQAWRPMQRRGGHCVVSECTWLTENPPPEIREFWSANYPSMGTVESNREVAEGAGYRVLSTAALPREAWHKGYYDDLGPRAQSLLDHEREAIRQFAEETLREIDLFERFGNSYGYVFYMLEAA